MSGKNAATKIFLKMKESEKDMLVPSVVKNKDKSLVDSNLENKFASKSETKDQPNIQDA